MMLRLRQPDSLCSSPSTNPISSTLLLYLSYFHLIFLLLPYLVFLHPPSYSTILDLPFFNSTSSIWGCTVITHTTIMMIMMALCLESEFQFSYFMLSFQNFTGSHCIVPMYEIVDMILFLLRNSKSKSSRKIIAGVTGWWFWCNYVPASRKYVDLRETNHLTHMKKALVQILCEYYFPMQACRRRWQGHNVPATSIQGWIGFSNNALTDSLPYRRYANHWHNWRSEKLISVCRPYRSDIPILSVRVVRRINGDTH